MPAGGREGRGGGGQTAKGGEGAGAAPSHPAGGEKKNSTDTIVELEILAQKMRAKIRINGQK